MSSDEQRTLAGIAELPLHRDRIGRKVVVKFCFGVTSMRGCDDDFSPHHLGVADRLHH